MEHTASSELDGMKVVVTFGRRALDAVRGDAHLTSKLAIPETTALHRT